MSCNCVRSSCNGVPQDLNQELLKQITAIEVNGDNTITITTTDAEGNTQQFTSSGAIDVNAAVKAQNIEYNATGSATIGQTLLSTVGDQIEVEIAGEVQPNGNDIVLNINGSNVLSIATPTNIINPSNIRAELRLIKTEGANNYVLIGKILFTNSEDNLVVETILVNLPLSFLPVSDYNFIMSQLGGTFNYINVNFFKQ